MITPFRDQSVLREAGVMAVVAVVLVACLVLPLIGGYTELATQILIWAIFALGFDLILGFTGFLSFGHAAFWGGGLCRRVWLLRVSDNVVPAIVVGVLVRRSSPSSSAI